MTKEGKGSEQLPEAICIAGPGSKVAKDLQVLVKKVAGQPEVLLIGETLEGKDIHGMMDTFVKDLFTTNCFPIHPGDSLKEPLAATTCNIGGTPCQLIFFLCRASCLQGKQKELRRVIKEVKKFVEKSPCALVGVVMDPKTSEAEAARDQLLRMLRGAFPKGSAQKQSKAGKAAEEVKNGPMELEDVEVEAEIYTPGHPRGNLAIVKAACRASEALIKSKGMPEEAHNAEVTKDSLTITDSEFFGVSAVLQNKINSMAPLCVCVMYFTILHWENHLLSVSSAPFKKSQMGLLPCVLPACSYGIGNYFALAFKITRAKLNCILTLGPLHMLRSTGFFSVHTFFVINLGQENKL
ncbi:uncharacterized protein C2orf72 homolog isoform X1 [Podarcis raffonei]|uniref:uncharacterized protein C2orf72 homolog isoform X1 n=1 Tax=Podarcis raffonei TaxID=65483 RepID=UPI0023291C04|nr:uncharacterized protein C2orf72 homolog isoform X1 [Podarcis raffonei]